MKNEMNAVLFLLFCFGFIGLLSFALIPLAIWRILKNIMHEKPYGKARVFFIFFVLMIAAPVILYEIDVAKMLFDCILWAQCGPSRGNRWFFLAFLGAAYVAVEILFFIVNAILKSQRRKRIKEI